MINAEAQSRPKRWILIDSFMTYRGVIETSLPHLFILFHTSSANPLAFYCFIIFTNPLFLHFTRYLSSHRHSLHTVIHPNHFLLSLSDSSLDLRFILILTVSSDGSTVSHFHFHNPSRWFFPTIHHNHPVVIRSLPPLWACRLHSADRPETLPLICNKVETYFRFSTLPENNNAGNDQFLIKKRLIENDDYLVLRDVYELFSSRALSLNSTLVKWPSLLPWLILPKTILGVLSFMPLSNSALSLVFSPVENVALSLSTKCKENPQVITQKSIKVS